MPELFRGPAEVGARVACSSTFDSTPVVDKGHAMARCKPLPRVGWPLSAKCAGTLQ